MSTSKKSKPAKPAAKAVKATKTAKAPKAPAKGKETAAKDDGKGGKRKLGLRGAAPWAARHAAKHAAEARARAAQPPLPGSARATIRTPSGAEDIKQKIGALHNTLVQVKALRKGLHKTFFDIGVILRDIQTRKLYEAKGYGTFDAFLEREIDLGKTTSLRLIRISQVFVKEAALEFGMDRCINGLLSLEAVPEASASGVKLEGAKIPPPPVSTSALPLRPPGR